MMIRALLSFSIVLSTLFAEAQELNIDSLIKLSEKLPDDTNKLNIYNVIASYGPDGVWEQYNERAGKLSQVLSTSSNQKIANKAKQIFGEYNENLGYLSGLEGNYYLTLEYLDKSLKIANELKDNSSKSRVLSSMASVYERQNENNKALEILLQALALQLKPTKDKTATLANLAVVYGKLNDTKKQLEYFKAAEKIIVENKHSNQVVPMVYRGIALIMYANGKDSLSYVYYNKCYNESVAMGDKRGESIGLEGLARLNFKKGAIAEAENLAIKALEIANVTLIPEDIKAAATLLKKIYLKNGNYKKAIEMSDIAAIADDSLTSITNQKSVLRYQYKSEFEAKQAIQKAEQEKKDAIQNNIRNSILLGLIAALIFLLIVFRQRNKISKARKRSDELLLNILPEEVAAELKEKGHTEAQLVDQVTVLFTDFKGFTAMSEKVTPKELVADLHACFSEFDRICEKYGIEKIKTIGDAYMAAGGLPIPNLTHANDIVLAALEMAMVVEKGKAKKIEEGKPFFEVRIGVHTGPVVAGIVGLKKFQYDIWGDTVNTASRIESSGEVGKVNISQATYDLLKDNTDFRFEKRGKIEAKGKGELDMYFVNADSNI